MYTLFLDTHDELITISFIKDDEIFTREVISEYSHSVHLLPLLDSMLKEKGITLNSFNKIIVVNGPGSFTGIRIGLTVAKTIAYSLNISINTISSLEAYLISSEDKNKNICVIEDPKGYYVRKGNEEYYTENIEDLNNENILINKLNIKKIVDNFKDLEGENVHTIKANYVKLIEALK